MEMCGEAENRLASELMHHEMQIEKDILEPLNQLAEVSRQVFPTMWTIVFKNCAKCDCFLYTDSDFKRFVYILCQMDIPNILKQRRQLAKLVLDYDSARTRWFEVSNLRIISIRITVSVIASHLVFCNDPYFYPSCLTIRWLQATKSIISGTNTQALTAKADSLKEEMDEAMNKMELCKVTHADSVLIVHWFKRRLF